MFLVLFVTQAFEGVTYPVPILILRQSYLAAPPGIYSSINLAAIKSRHPAKLNSVRNDDSKNHSRMDDSMVSCMYVNKKNLRDEKMMCAKKVCVNVNTPQES